MKTLFVATLYKHGIDMENYPVLVTAEPVLAGEDLPLLKSAVLIKYPGTVFTDDTHLCPFNEHEDFGYDEVIITSVPDCSYLPEPSDPPEPCYE